MPRRVAPASYQRQPLDLVLGAVGNVRILRTLASFGGPLPASRIAAESHMSLNGAINSLTLLERLGAIRTIGSSRTRLYRLATEHPLGAAASAMFVAERERFDEILDAIRNAADVPGVIATWLFGSVARNEDGVDSDVDIAVVIDRPEKEVSEIADAIRDRLALSADQLTFNPSLVSLSMEQVQRLIERREPLWESLQSSSRTLKGESPDQVASRIMERTTQK